MIRTPLPRSRRAAQGAQRGLRAGANRAASGRSAEARQCRIQELEGGGGAEQQPSGGFLDSMRDAVFGQSQPRGSVPNVPPPSGRPPGMEQRPGDAAGAGRRDNIVRRPTVSRMAHPSKRRWAEAAIISGNRGSGGGRHGRRIAAARQHPLDDGRQPPGLRRSAAALATEPKTAGRGATNPAAIWRAMPASTTSVHPAGAGADGSRARIVRSGASNDDQADQDHDDDGTWIRTISAATTAATATTPDRVSDAHKE